VRVSLERTRKVARLRIEDNGPGVPPGEEENIFKAFVTKRAGGTGFGLAIARRIIEGHGGKIFAERSELLGGAAFVVDLPLAG